jgi:hypothetical protein
MIYLNFYLFFILLFSGSIFSKKYTKDFIFIIFIFIGSIYSGSRLYIGGDYGAYREIYLLNFDLFRYIELGYLLLNWIIFSFGFSYEAYLIIVNLITNTLLFIALRKLSPSYVISIMVYLGMYYLQHQFNWIRQGMASVIVLNALIYFKNNPKKYIILTIMASFFHIIAVLTVFLPFIFKSIKYKYYIPIVLVVAVIFKFNTIINTVLDFVAVMSDNFLIGKLRYYLIENTDYAHTLNIFSFSSLKRFTLLLFIVIFAERLSKKFKFFHEISLFYFISMIVYYILQFNEVVAARASQIFQFVDLIIFVLPFLIFKSIHMKYLYFFALLSYLIYTYLVTINNIGANFLPYKSFLF